MGSTTDHSTLVCARYRLDGGIRSGMYRVSSVSKIQVAEGDDEVSQINVDEEHLHRILGGRPDSQALYKWLWDRDIELTSECHEHLIKFAMRCVTDESKTPTGRLINILAWIVGAYHMGYTVGSETERSALREKVLRTFGL